MQDSFIEFLNISNFIKFKENFFNVDFYFDLLTIDEDLCVKLDD